MPELNGTTTNKYNEVDASCNASPPDGAPAGMFPNQSEGVWRAGFGALQRFWNRINGSVTTTGSSNAYVYTPVNTGYPTALVQGEIYTFKANFANTGTATLNINSLGATAIYKKGATGAVALAGGEIQSGDLISVAYDGSNFQLLTSLAANNFGVSIQTFTSSGTYTPTAGMVTCTIECWGGGGGGGGVTGTSSGALVQAAGGGAAGGYSRKTVAAATIGSSQTVTIGVAGTAGASGNNSGGAGGTTSVGSICVANGGGGGSYAAYNAQPFGGTGASAGTGDIAAVSAQGGFGISSTTGQGPSGAGGSTLVGSGGFVVAATNGATATGNAGAGYGAGGSGGSVVNANSNIGGGAGTAGFVIITEFL